MSALHPTRQLVEFTQKNGRKVRLCPKSIEAFNQTDSNRVYVVTQTGQTYHLDIGYDDFVEAIRQRPENAEGAEPV